MIAVSHLNIGEWTDNMYICGKCWLYTKLHLIALKHPTLVHLSAVRSFPEINLSEPLVLYIGRAYRYPPDVALYIYFFFSTTISTEYFKHAAHSPFFSSKCRSLHNATFFGSCIIHILHTEFAKISM
jgi:hypothetical protein